jgi:hypothetical protein
LKDSSGGSRLRGNFKKLQKPLALIVQGFFQGSRLRGNFKNPASIGYSIHFCVSTFSLDL